MSSLSYQDIGLAPSQLKAVERKARDAGKSAGEYVRLLVERDLLSDKPFDEILRPIRQDVRRAGVSEAAIDKIVRKARRSAGGKRPAKSRGPRK